MSNTTWNNEQASLEARDNAAAVKGAVEQALCDLPGSEVREAVLCSKTVPLGRDTSHLTVQGPRWYVRTTLYDEETHFLHRALYRVWQDQREMHAAFVRNEGVA